MAVGCGHTVQPSSEWDIEMDRETDRQTDGLQDCFMPPSVGRGHNNCRARPECQCWHKEDDACGIR